MAFVNAGQPWQRQAAGFKAMSMMMMAAGSWRLSTVFGTDDADLDVLSSSTSSRPLELIS
jgi:hypothetical protein